MHSFNKFEKKFCPITSVILFSFLILNQVGKFSNKNLSIAPKFLKAVLLMYKNKECVRPKSAILNEQ